MTRDPQFDDDHTPIEHFENLDRGNPRWRFLREVRDTIVEVDEDVDRRDMALLGRLMNAQTNHESDVRSSISQVFRVRKKEYSDKTKLEVKALATTGATDIRKPEQDGQFGKWKMERVRTHTTDHEGHSATAELLYQNEIEVELTVYSPKLFLEYFQEDFVQELDEGGEEQ